MDKLIHILSCGISQEELSNYLGISRPTLSLYIQNKGGSKVFKFINLINEKEVIYDIKYNQFINNIRAIKKYVPDRKEEFLYSDKKFHKRKFFDNF